MEICDVIDVIDNYKFQLQELFKQLSVKVQRA